jgi:hypothetical protein
MIETPFVFESDFTPAEFEKLGRLVLRWSHIEHILGNCLKAMLSLTDEQALYTVFPLSFEHRINRIQELSEIRSLSPEAKNALAELRWLAKGIQSVRSTAVHAVVARNEAGLHADFELRSKQRKMSKAQIFASEELTNYAAHAALAFRVWLGGKIDPGPWHTLPSRPPVPGSLQTWFQAPHPNQKGERKSQQKPSRGK